MVVSNGGLTEKWQEPSGFIRGGDF